VTALGAEFETSLLSLRAELLTFSSWQLSPDSHVRSNVKQLLGNAISHARWHKRTLASKSHLAECQLSAMAHSEYMLFLAKKHSLLEPLPHHAPGEVVEGEPNFASSVSAFPSGVASSLYEHDVETRKNNLFHRFNFISQLVFSKPAYINVESTSDASEALGFAPDPSIVAQMEKDRLELLKSGIFTDPKSVLQVALASDFSIVDIHIDAFGKYIHVGYEYDKPAKHFAKWVLEALVDGKVRTVEKLISAAYHDRCLRHQTLSISLQSQFQEATKLSQTHPSSRTSHWANQASSAPDVASVHARLLSLECDLITISRLETQKYGLEALQKGIGWTTMNASGPVVTFFVNPLKMASEFGKLRGRSSGNSKSDSETPKLEKLLASASEEHLSILESLPHLIESIPPASEKFPNMPAYTSNVLAPELLSRLNPNTSLCATHLFGNDNDDTVSRKESKDALSFHVEIEQGSVFDPVTLQRVGGAPRSSSSSIVSVAMSSTNENNNYTGTLQAMTVRDLEAFSQLFSPHPSSLDPSCELPSHFMDLGIVWTPFAQCETEDDRFLPLVAKLKLDTEMPFYFCLFQRLRALSASSDPSGLLTHYYLTDEALRLGKTPPAAFEPPKPKKITFRMSKGVASSSPPPPPSTQTFEPNTPFKGAVLSSLSSKRTHLLAANFEDVVQPFTSTLFPSTPHLLHAMVRCIQKTGSESSPSCLMVKSMTFVDSRQLRALVSILRQQAVINAIYDSCFQVEQNIPYSVYLTTPMKHAGHVSSEGRLQLNPSTSNSLGKPGLASSTSQLNSSFELASPSRNRSKRSRTEMEALLHGNDSHHQHHKTMETALNTSIHAMVTLETLSQAKTADCKITIELTALAEPLMGWSVMARCSPSSFTSLFSAVGSLGQEEHGEHPNKKAKLNASSSDVPTSAIIFSFAIHIAVDGYIHVIGTECESVVNERRSIQRLQNLLRATHHLPIALQSWLKGVL